MKCLMRGMGWRNWDFAKKDLLENVWTPWRSFGAVIEGCVMILWFRKARRAVVGPSVCRGVCGLCCAELSYADHPSDSRSSTITCTLLEYALSSADWSLNTSEPSIPPTRTRKAGHSPYWHSVTMHCWVHRGTDEGDGPFVSNPSGRAPYLGPLVERTR